MWNREIEGSEEDKQNKHTGPGRAEHGLSDKADAEGEKGTGQAVSQRQGH